MMLQPRQPPIGLQISRLAVCLFDYSDLEGKYNGALIFIDNPFIIY